MSKSLTRLRIGGAIALTAFGFAAPLQAAHLFAEGENGLWNAYLLDLTPRTWDQARVNAGTRTIMGAQGNLVAISDLAENFRITGVAGRRDAWIGLTDATGPSTLDGATFPTTEGNFVWVTNEPLFTNWGAGEPNDVNGEDATHIRADGFWNDHQAGTSLGQADITMASVVEFRLQLTSAQVALTPSIKVVSYKSSNTQIANFAAADALIAGFDQARTPTTSYYTRLSMTDSGGEGDFVGDNGVVGIFNEEDFAVQGTGFIRIDVAGAYVFRLNADDGQRLRLDTNGDNVLEDIVVDDVLSGPHNVDSPSISLTPGLYAMEWTWFERSFGAEGELSASRDGGAFVPLGDTANGGLAVTQVPEPALSALALVVLGVVAGRRPRRPNSARAVGIA